MKKINFFLISIASLLSFTGAGLSYAAFDENRDQPVFYHQPHENRGGMENPRADNISPQQRDTVVYYHLSQWARQRELGGPFPQQETDLRTGKPATDILLKWQENR